MFGDLEPGQDEEPRVYHEADVLLAQLRCPADEEVTQGEHPGGAAVAEYGERPSILQLRSHSY